MAGRIEWNGAKLVADLKRAQAQGIQKALDVYAMALRRRIGRQGSEGNRSRPGEPPRKQSGYLQGSIYTNFDPVSMTGQVELAEDAFYGHVLEKGTVNGRIRPRPWIIVTFLEVRQTMARLAANG